MADTNLRRGIISAGNWIIDHIKMIDTWPQQGNLVNISEVAPNSPGGCSHNVLVDLAKMQTGLPLWAGGILGDDSDGAYIRNIISDNGIDGTYMEVRQGVPTSFTDVMTVEGTGARTFFHSRGANALLGYEEIAEMDVPAKIFHLGYLLLLDKMDESDPEFGTVAARTLKMLLDKGYKTSIDVVSEEGDRFARIMTPSLKYTDFLIINEVEASGCTGRRIRLADNSIDMKELAAAVDDLFASGVRDTVVIHYPEGGYACRKGGVPVCVRSFPPGRIKGTVGAGDAFCAGALYALHEEMPLDQVLMVANASAHFNLTCENSTGGAVPYSKLEEFIKENR